MNFLVFLGYSSVFLGGFFSDTFYCTLGFVINLVVVQLLSGHICEILFQTLLKAC